MKDYNFKFSVIIPVYKVEEYLEETIESVLDQTIGFKENIQMILVNDGSPDNSGEICERYKQLFPDNIEYIVQKNAGVSAARNAGIPHIQGKYVNFLDSDDKWSPDAFETAYGFFEEHYDEIDVLAARIRFFEAKSDFHILDYKFYDGDRVVDITQPEDSIFIQMHVSSSFIKASALTKQHRFNKNIKYGEDSLFVNQIILEKGAYGLLKTCLFYYRRRSDASSAVQTQRFNLSFYTDSPKLHYSGLIQDSVERYGSVIEYVQQILAYDIGWRASILPPEKGFFEEKIIEDYKLFLRSVLSNVSDRVLLKSKVHKRIIVKDALFRLKYSDECGLYDRVKTDPDKKAFYYKDICICRLKKISHSCTVHICRIEEERLVIEGVITRWLFECVKKNDVSFVLKNKKKLRRIKLLPDPLVKEKCFFGENDRYYRFKISVPVSNLFKKSEVAKLQLAIRIDSKVYVIGFRYGKYIPTAENFPENYSRFGDCFMQYRKNKIIVERVSDPIAEYKKREKQCSKWLRNNGKAKLARIRTGCRLFRKFVLKGRQLWLISDRFEFARDNGKAFFKYLSEHPEKTKGILPVFVISKYSPDVPEVQKIGKTVFFEDDEFLYYYLCASKIISSAASDFIVNPLKPDVRDYLMNIRNCDFIFLQHGITKDDLSGWLNKFNKDIKTFITAGRSEYKSIVKGNYFYDKSNVALTGFARFDALENNPKKLVCVIPTWRKYIPQSYDANTNSVYFDGFKEHEYFKFYNHLINDERLLDCMRKKGYKGLFCLHPIHSKQYIDYQENDVFTINSTEVNYSKMFSEGSLLVTDFSSVFFDFAYLKKPVVYSQFDRDLFFKTHSYDEGYFSYEDNGFGPVCYDYEATVNAIIGYIENDCRNPQKYIDRVDAFFKYSDRNNCKRIYKAITGKKKKKA